VFKAAKNDAGGMKRKQVSIMCPSFRGPPFLVVDLCEPKVLLPR